MIHISEGAQIIFADIVIGFGIFTIVTILVCIGIDAVKYCRTH